MTRKRYSVFSLRFHPTGRNYPNVGPNLRPIRQSRFARPASTQCKKFEAQFRGGHALLARIFSTAAPTSPNGSARWCCTGWLFLGKAAMIASPAGLSGRNPCAMLHFMTAPIRCRTFLAVSRLVKIGANTFQTSAVPTSETSFCPKIKSGAIGRIYQFVFLFVIGLFYRPASRRRKVIVEPGQLGKPGD